MPKVNTLFNYFTSPKTDKRLVKETSSPQRESPKSNGDQKGRGARGLKAGKENSNKENKRGTPTSRHQIKSSSVATRKRSSNKETEADETSRPKRRRLIIPSDNSDDSGDDYKPTEDDASSSEFSASEADSESEALSSGVESDEETPKKKRNIEPKSAAPKKNSRGKTQVKSELKNSDPPSQTTGNSSVNTQGWSHLKYDFLQKNKIKDIHQRPPSDPNYDPRTLYVPHYFKINQTPAMKQWWEMKCKNFDCVIFFKVGKFYELYHMDAVTGVNELGLSYMRGEFAHSGFPEIAYSRFASSLIEKGYKVARVEQTENPEMMSARVSKMSQVTKFDKVVKREICQISSKGTRVFTAQDSETSTASSTYLLSIVEKFNPSTPTSIYGVCFIDTSIGGFHLGQFEDDRHSSRLLTLVSHFPPSQVIYERGGISERTNKILNTMLATALKEPLQRETQFWSAATTLKKLHEGEYFKSEFNSDFTWPEGLKPYLSDGDSLGLTAADNMELAISALGGCVFHLKECFIDQQLLAQGRFESWIPPDHEDRQSSGKFANNMVLDAITINNLRILGGPGSLISMLDHCCTPFGKRLLREWICRPSCRKSEIMQRQQAVTELIDKIEIMQNVRGSLAPLPDLERLLSKIHAQGNFAKGQSHPDARAIMYESKTYSKRRILDFTNALHGFEEASKIIDSIGDVKCDLLKRCIKHNPEGDFPELEEMLNYFKSAFNQEEAKKEGCIIPKPGVDSEYDAVLEEVSEIKRDLEKYLEQQRKHFGVKVNYFGTEKKRFQIEVPDSQLRKVTTVYELQSQRKGFRRYYTAEAKELLERQIAAETNKDKVLKDISRRIFAKFSEKYDVWCSAVYQLATLDVLTAFAEYSQSAEMSVPIIEDLMSEKSAFIDIRDGRHPCVTSDDFIPNDTLLGTEDSASLVILTGPNMGGKSTVMRQVGLLTIMAQIGCHIPASSCRLTLVDRIFTRLGANDDILTGQSTFFVELSETATILQHATPNSLVLVDELGRGTSTYDGTAIAASVVGALKERKCRTLFSTHYHALVEDYKLDKNVSLSHMACMVETEEEEEVSQETVTFLYKLSKGACPKSYGFNAARLAGISSKITLKAHEIASKLENEVNQRHFLVALFKGKSDLKTLLAALK
ncbi:probable DNA mismatch repair protein Msh6 [Neodiprion pinetum]|uniref:probable DNA mismatch repair protein Msh6 n=1 Tax=Neodiprion pinetum TaxID=441929 RepID=UPI001EE137B0|nr:probable DNA mismatch repair protein Msh6 [Neodiprion pinetum]